MLPEIEVRDENYLPLIIFVIFYITPILNMFFLLTRKVSHMDVSFLSVTEK